jgi:hypothetical protein
MYVLRFLCEGQREATLWHIGPECGGGGVKGTTLRLLSDNEYYGVDGYNGTKIHGLKDGQRLKMQVYNDGLYFLCDHRLPLSDNPTGEEFEEYDTERLDVEENDLVMHSGATHTEEDVNVAAAGDEGHCCKGTITVIGTSLGDAGVRYFKAPPKQLRLSRKIQEDLTIRATFFYRMEKLAETAHGYWDTILISTVDLTKPGSYTLDSNSNLIQVSAHGNTFPCEVLN